MTSGSQNKSQQIAQTKRPLVRDPILVSPRPTPTRTQHPHHQNQHRLGALARAKHRATRPPRVFASQTGQGHPRKSPIRNNLLGSQIQMSNGARWELLYWWHYSAPLASEARAPMRGTNHHRQQCSRPRRLGYQNLQLHHPSRQDAGNPFLTQGRSGHQMANPGRHQQAT